MTTAVSEAVAARPLEAWEAKALAALIMVVSEVVAARRAEATGSKPLAA